jgi:amino acid transporter
VRHSFVPYGAGSVVAGAGTIFFAFLGFDTVSSLAEEVRDPQRSMPVGIIGSLSIATVVYVSVSLVVTGMVPFPLLATAEAPLAFAFREAGVGWASWVVNVGALFGLTTGCFTSLFGQPRIFHRMAVDGLLFPALARVDARGVPRAGTVAAGVFAATIALFVSLDALADAISVGTLSAFTIVDAGVILLRLASPATQRYLVSLLLLFAALVLVGSLSFSHAGPWALTGAAWGLALVPFALLHRVPAPPPDADHAAPPHAFRCPLVPTVPLVGMAVNILMLGGLSADAWLRLAGWTLLGVAVYAFYGHWHSKLREPPPPPPTAKPAAGDQMHLDGAQGG